MAPLLHRAAIIIAERLNTVQTRRKVFAILGEAKASLPSNGYYCKFTNDSVGELILKMVSIWQSYGQEYRPTVFFTHSVLST